MWIKNQSRKLIANVNMVFISEEENSNIIYGENGSSDVVLGEYKDAARALEVLDTIADRLEDGMDFSEDVKGQIFNRHMIFEMPVR